MKSHSPSAGFLLCLALIASAEPARAGTFTRLNDGDPHPSWAVPRINNAGHVSLIRATTSSYSGAVYLWSGTWAGLAPFPGASMSNMVFQPRIELNDLDRIAYTIGGEAVRTADLSGVIPLGAAPTSLNYAIDINNNNRVAAFTWHAYMHNDIHTADPPYTTYAAAVTGGDILTYHVAINDSGQVAWRPNGTSSNIYCFTPGVGSVAIGASDYAPFDLDNAGQIIHVRDRNKIMLGNLVLRRSAAVWRNTDQYAQPRVSDDGRHVVWTEFDGTRWNLWTLVDGLPTNLTLGGYHDVLAPDVNNAGTIVFASATSMWVDPYVSDVYLYEDAAPEPLVYNGHFDGQTWFGWRTVLSGAAAATLEPRVEGGYAARLVAGSPAGMEQAIDLPAGVPTLAFDFDFPTSGGQTLTIALDGEVVAQLLPVDDTEPGFTPHQLTLPAVAPPGRTGALLSFRLDGAPGTAIQLDNVGVTVAASGVFPDPGFDTLVRLMRVTPNPFGASMTLHYELDQPGRVNATICDARGRHVATLGDDHRQAGAHRASWAGTNDEGRPMASGVYFLRLRVGRETRVAKVTLVR